jgi:hypothetical protein
MLKSACSGHASIRPQEQPPAKNRPPFKQVKLTPSWERAPARE